MLRWLRRKAVGFLLNSLELEEKPAHSGIFCEDSHSLLCWSPRTECAFRQGSLGAVSAPRTECAFRQGSLGAVSPKTCFGYEGRTQATLQVGLQTCKSATT